MSRKIVVHPDIGAISADDIEKTETGVEVRRTDNIVAALSEESCPVAFVVSNSTWRDEYLDALSPRDWVSTIGVGYENFPLEEFSAAGIAFSNHPGISAEQIAEHVFGSVFAFTRKLWTYRDQQKRGVWEKHRWEMTDLAGDKCCILGLGGIGEAVATRAKAFGMEVCGIKRSVEHYSGAADSVYQPNELKTAITGSKLLVIAVPLTDRTHRMIGSREIRMLPPNAILVNVARGPVLDTQALLSALDDSLGAACLDVTEPEPLPSGHPLWEREDVLITPHCAGSSEKYPDRFTELFIEQYERWCNDDSLDYRIT